jgi:phospholipid transport system substrate-binding protein
MSHPKRFTRPLQFLLLMLAALLAMPARAEIAEPERIVRETTDQVIENIKQNLEAYKKDPARLYAMVDELVLPRFDFERMTALALGRYKRKVRGDQKERLVQEFRNLLVRTYSKALLEYNDQKVIFLPMRGSVAQGDVTVRTEIDQPGGFPIPINYSLYLKDGEWKVYDVVIDNISMVTNYRSSFAREIKNKGVEGLIKTLQARNEQQKNG